MTVSTLSRVPTLDIDPFGDDFLADPYAFHGELRDAGPLFWLERYGLYGMARHGEVSTALRDWQTYSSARGVGLSDFAVEKPWRPPSLLLETDPPVHDHMRAIMNKVVHPITLKALRPIWLERAERLIDRIVEAGSLDAVRDLAEAYPMLVFPDTIGLREDGREALLAYAMATFNAFGPRNAIFEATDRAAQPAITWVADACKRENLSDDGWGMAIYRASDEGLCTAAEAERLVRSFLSAGVDTTVNGIANMINAFALFPEEWAKLRETPSLTKKAFEESLRWDSTVQTFFRTTTCDVDVEGHVIPEGSKVLLFLAAANRDSRRWPDAERFDISRSASGHVGFGFGIHQCLGQMVARLEAEMVLEAMIPRVKEIRIDGTPTRRLNNTLHALATLPCAFVPA